MLYPTANRSVTPTEHGLQILANFLGRIGQKDVSLWHGRETLQLKQQLRIAAIVVATTFLSSGCTAASNKVENADTARHMPSTAPGNNVTDTQLPINQRFRTLDDYLAWLQQTQGPIDKPWYKQIRPGVYELQTGNFRSLSGDGGQKRTFTRDELEKKFGFSH
jgi:hypothetical protein